MTLDEFLEKVYVPLRLRGRSPESVRLLRHAIRQFSKWLGRPAVLEDFDDLVVSRFLTVRAETLAPDSVARERSGLIALWNLAQGRGLVRLRPCVAPELVPERTPRAFSVDELDRLFAACRQSRGFVGPVQADVWFVALAATLFYSGERIAAVLACPRENWRAPFLDVPAGVRKGGRKPQVHELPPDVSALVDRVAAHDGPVVFWWPFSGTALRKRWRNITRRAGLGDGREVQFHALRRSFASWLEVGGGQASEALGHESERTTRKYLDPRITRAGRPAPWQLLPRILPGPDEPPATVRIA